MHVSVAFATDIAQSLPHMPQFATLLVMFAHMLPQHSLVAPGHA